MKRRAIMGLSCLVAALTACSPEPPAETAPCAGCNVVLITLDTVSARHLPCYGYPEDTAPNVCALAKDGTLFTDALSQSSWTLPSHASILTGEYPNKHRAESRQTRVDDDAPRLPRILGREGYATGAIVSGRFVSRTYGFRRGFHFFDAELIQPGNRDSFAEAITDKAITWVDDQEQPFFLWLHYFDAHNAFLRHDAGYAYAPDTADEDIDYGGWNRPGIKQDYFLERRDDMVTLYDGELHFTDAQVGRLIDHLDASGALERTIVIVTSDHGESFGEHNLFGHGNMLYRELVHVPLIMRAPHGGSAAGGAVVETPQETKDIFHTVLSQLGIDAPSASGYDLLTDRREHAFAEVISRQHEKRVAIVTKQWKLIYTLDDAVELFDRSADPDETSNVAEANPEVVKDLLARLTDEMNVVILDEEALDELRALGYVN